jgi:hypothetical protein
MNAGLVPDNRAENRREFSVKNRRLPSFLNATVHHRVRSTFPEQDRYREAGTSVRVGKAVCLPQVPRKRQFACHTGKKNLPVKERPAYSGKIAAVCAKPKNRRCAYMDRKYLCNIHIYPNETIINNKKCDKTN